MVYQLAENGTMAVVVPHGVLFRGVAKGHIKHYMIENCNYLDAVIGLSTNIFYGTSIINYMVLRNTNLIYSIFI